MHVRSELTNEIRLKMSTLVALGPTENSSASKLWATSVLSKE